MSDYGGPRVIGRIFVLLILVIALAGGGLLWFDYLNVVDAKALLAPAFRFLGIGTRSQPVVGADTPLSLDNERYEVLVEAVELRERELEKQAEEIQGRRGEIEQMAQELEERQKALDERESSLNAVAGDTETRQKNIEQNARNLTGMPPANAVAILAEMTDQDAIDVLRMTEAIAQREGASSMVSYWLSQLPAKRAAELQRKMTTRP